MNSRKRDHFGFKKPICPENKNEIFQFLSEMKDYISSLKIYIKRRRIFRRSVTMKIIQKKLVLSARKTDFIGFVICIDSF